MADEVKNVNLSSIIKDGIVVRWPKKAEERSAVLNYLITKFEPGVQYKELQVNMTLKKLNSFGDHVLLRRELCDSGLMQRDPVKGIYWIEKKSE